MKATNNARGSILIAELCLRKADPVMADLIDRHGHCTLEKLPYQPFHTIVSSIISQQLSLKAANTIEHRISQITSKPFQPADIVKIPLENLRKAGLSTRKAGYIHELSKRVIEGSLAFDVLEQSDNEAIITTLTKLPGIGRWTAEMFLIFGMKRLDVLATDDVGLQRAVRLLYGDDQNLKSISGPWRSVSSVASWYLWRHIDAT